MGNVKEKILKEISRSQRNMAFDNMAYSTGLSCLPTQRTMTRHRVVVTQAVPVMAKMVTILWDNVIAGKDCYNVYSLW